MPVVRQIVRRASGEQYRFSAVVEGIINSAPFRMRTSQDSGLKNQESGLKNQSAMLQAGEQR
jgi:hypothetical protein